MARLGRKWVASLEAIAIKKQLFEGLVHKLCGVSTIPAGRNQFSEPLRFPVHVIAALQISILCSLTYPTKQEPLDTDLDFVSDMLKRSLGLLI